MAKNIARLKHVQRSLTATVVATAAAAGANLGDGASYQPFSSSLELNFLSARQLFTISFQLSIRHEYCM
jgi:hypothetical protein